MCSPMTQFIELPTWMVPIEYQNKSSHTSSALDSSYTAMIDDLILKVEQCSAFLLQDKSSSLGPLRLVPLAELDFVHETPWVDVLVSFNST